jgi:RNA polymerase sigma-70 factor (ECF subfamily)
MIVSVTTSAADIALLDRIARRDQAGLAELYDRHCRLLFSLILRILRDRGEAEDVLQEVFIRVWDRADSYNPSLGTPAAWLVRTGARPARTDRRSRAGVGSGALRRVDRGATGDR